MKGHILGEAAVGNTLPWGQRKDSLEEVEAVGSIQLMVGRPLQREDLKLNSYMQEEEEAIKDSLKRLH